MTELASLELTRLMGCVDSCLHEKKAAAKIKEKIKVLFIK